MQQCGLASIRDVPLACMQPRTALLCPGGKAGKVQSLARRRLATLLG